MTIIRWLASRLETDGLGSHHGRHAGEAMTRPDRPVVGSPNFWFPPDAQPPRAAPPLLGLAAVGLTAAALVVTIGGRILKEAE